MSDQLTIEKGWLIPQLESKIGAENGFYYFEDGDFRCVLMAGESVSAMTVNRTKKELFHETVENSDARLQLVLNANYGALAAGGMRDAVLQDGSTSVMMYYKRPGKSVKSATRTE